MEFTATQQQHLDRLITAGQGIKARMAKLPEGHPQIKNFERNLDKYERMLEQHVGSDAIAVFRTALEEA